MASRRSTAIRAALQGKGFRVDEGDHHWLVLYAEGRRTPVRTKVSHGNIDYGDELLSRVKWQLRLSTSRELLRLIDCPMEFPEYLALLRDKGVVAP